MWYATHDDDVVVVVLKLLRVAWNSTAVACIDRIVDCVPLDDLQSKWSVFFSSIVTRATTVETFATGVGEGGYDGTLQLV